MTEKQLAAIQRGSLAEIALSTLGVVIEKKQKEYLSLLTANSRKQDFDHAKLISFAASYAALEDVLDELRRQIRIANTQSKEVLNGRPEA